MKLHFSDYSPPCFGVRLFLACEFNQLKEVVHFRRWDTSVIVWENRQSRVFSQLNPAKRVPVLEFDSSGRGLAESNAILRFLVDDQMADDPRRRGAWWGVPSGIDPSSKEGVLSSAKVNNFLDFELAHFKTPFLSIVDVLATHDGDDRTEAINQLVVDLVRGSSSMFFTGLPNGLVGFLEQVENHWLAPPAESDPNASAEPNPTGSCRFVCSVHRPSLADLPLFSDLLGLETVLGVQLNQLGQFPRLKAWQEAMASWLDQTIESNLPEPEVGEGFGAADNEEGSADAALDTSHCTPFALLRFRFQQSMAEIHELLSIPDLLSEPPVDDDGGHDVEYGDKMRMSSDSLTGAPPAGDNDGPAQQQRDQQAMWLAEEQLSLEERRQRYHRAKYVTLEELDDWDSVSRQVCARPSATSSVRSDGSGDSDSEGQLGTMTKSTTDAGASVGLLAADVDEDSGDGDGDGDEQMNAAPVAQERGNHESAASAVGQRFRPDQRLNRKILLFHGDMTTLESEAIVNAANRRCLGGGGIDGAIHRAAGSALYNECLLLNGCETGQAKITRGYDLPAKFVIHTVGPIGEDPEALQSCYESVLQTAFEHGIRSVAFCGISTGVYGYPLRNACHVALRTIRQWLSVPVHCSALDSIVLVTFTSNEKLVYEQTLPVYFPPVWDVESFVQLSSESEGEPAADRPEGE